MMKQTKINLLFPVLLLCFSCGNVATDEAVIEAITPAEANRLPNLNQEIMVLEVRTPEEYEAGHIEGAVNISVYAENFNTQVNQLDKNKTYIVHCAANVENGRSAKSINIMTDAGFKDIMSLEGGFTRWQSEGFDVSDQ